MSELKYKIPENLRVLAIDDSKMIHVMLEDIFSKLGVKDLTFVLNGQEGFDKLNDSIKNQTYFNLVLTDINMPVLNGIDMLKKINNMRLEPLPPILVLSAESDINTFMQVNELGAVDFITKPFKIDDVREKLLRVLYPDANNPHKK